jgi:hypothetical protein
MFYGKFESCQRMTRIGNEYLSIHELGREFIASYRWDRSPEFKNLTLNEMKDKITQEAKIMLKDGQVIFLLPV